MGPNIIYVGQFFMWVTFYSWSELFYMKIAYIFMLVRKGVINHYDFGIPAIYQVRFIYMYLLNYVLLISMVTSPLLSQLK